ncbi:hypothetical protein D8S78_18695 [Natrialba swarupiae]|nr:hypothetical protein [Natrialba swarupiae]
MRWLRLDDNPITGDGDGDGGEAGDASGATTGVVDLEAERNRGEIATFGDVRFENSYAMELSEFEMDDAARTVEITGRYYRGDYYQRSIVDGQEVENYHVDGDHYMVTDGMCIEGSGSEGPIGDVDADETADFESHEDLTGTHPELEAVGTESIDGEEMTVFEIDDGEPITYYVSVETGYLRRAEFEDGTMDFHSWGDVDPIETPEMDCQSF